MNIPDSVKRVPDHTADHLNERIEDELDRRLIYYAKNPHRIPARLKELDEEWDTERVLEANAATLAFAGTVVGAMGKGSKALILPAAVTAFLFQHAVQGWCPPLSILRRFGVRTRYEIELERYALKALRGDFENARPASLVSAGEPVEGHAAAAKEAAMR